MRLSGQPFFPASAGDTGKLLDEHFSCAFPGFTLIRGVGVDQSWLTWPARTASAFSAGVRVLPGHAATGRRRGV